MKPAIREILQYVIDHPGITTRAAVDSYFDQFLWSIGKQEWDSLNDQEKQLFVAQLNAAKGRPPKGPGLGWEITNLRTNRLVTRKGRR